MAKTSVNLQPKDPSPHFYQHRGWRFLSYGLWIGLLIVLLVLTLAGSALVESFWTPASLRILVQTWLVSALLIPPMVLIVASGGLDLSVGAVTGLVSVLMALLLAGEHANEATALALGLLVALAIGVVNALLVGAARLPGALVTLAVAALLRGIVAATTEGRPVMVRDAGLLAQLPVLAGVLVVLLSIATVLFVELVPAGRRRYLGTHETRSRLWGAVLSGLPYVLSALMAGLVGAWYLGRLRMGLPTAGAGLEVDTLLAVFLGGTPWAGGLANVVGAMLAGLLLALGRNLAVLGGTPGMAVEAAKGAALLVAAALSHGYFAAAGWLFGRRARIAAVLPKTEEPQEPAGPSGPEPRKAWVDIGGEKYLLASDDSYLDYIKNGFEPDMIRLYRTVANNSEVILDIGANIGCTALLFARLSKAVYAFEPSPTTFAFLQENVAHSGRNNVFLQNVGLGAEPGEFTLTFSPSNRSGGFVSNQTQASAGHTIEKINVYPLDEMVKSLNLPRIDFIKIDVEGFEGQVLRGAAQTLSAHKPVVILELNHWCLNAFQRTSIPDFFDFLRAQFPILLAVDNTSYVDLHDENDSYSAMYHHILHMRFPNIVAAFDEDRLRTFRDLYQHQFPV